MFGEKITVIVPVYKVEPYLRKCLDSIVNQTYQNLEIILVDDGSPDACGAICDEYATKDARIQVLHKENGGVSSARNAGLRIATGEWIGWVDSDDWIEADMYEYLLQNALRYDADVAVCGRVERYSNQENVVWHWEDIQVWDQERAIEQVLEDRELKNYLCDKLWRRSLFEGILFPEGQIYEDIIVTCQLLLKVGKVIGLPQIKYNYRQRSDSIVGNQSFSQQISYIQAVKQQMEFLGEAWPQYVDRMAAQYITAALGIWMTYCGTPKDERIKHRETLRRIAEFAGRYQGSALQYKNLGVTGRVVLRLIPYDTWWAFGLASLAERLYRWKHGRCCKKDPGGKEKEE